MNLSFPATSFNPSFLGLQRYILFLFYPNLFYPFCDLFFADFLVSGFNPVLSLSLVSRCNPGLHKKRLPP